MQANYFNEHVVSYILLHQNLNGGSCKLDKGAESILGGFGKRHTLCLMWLLGLLRDQKEASQICFSSEDYKGNASFSKGNFDWDEKIQGHILGSFFYGYVITNVIGGPASHYFGARLVAGFGIGLSSY
ncbi:Sialin [Armadillidium vulgare]|nr:Sialin [Armadillidium vulgare]